jgi:glycosyltransferase involved in cell wall biosynthesis
MTATEPAAADVIADQAVAAANAAAAADADAAIAAMAARAAADGVAEGTPRIAVVQPGHFAEARRIVASGRSEPYFGMTHSVESLDRLLAGRPHLVVSLDAPDGSSVEGDGVLVGATLRPTRWPGGGTWAAMERARRIVRLLAGFRPTHLLLRIGGLMGGMVLRYALRSRVSTLAVFAAVFDRGCLYERLVNGWVARMLNDPLVHAAGNHRRPAVESMIECGLDPAKARAWDWPGTRHPRDLPPKDPPAAGRPAEIVFAGNLIEEKGVGDLIRAAATLPADRARLTVIGDGDAAESFRAMAEALAPGRVDFTGRLGNDEVFARMRAADIVCVPTRHRFTEGFPMVLTESLAARTPVVCSDHPAITRALREGEGVRFFPASRPDELARVLSAVASDPAGYAKLSRTTADAFARVECPATFGDLLDDWQKGF